MTDLYLAAETVETERSDPCLYEGQYITRFKRFFDVTLVLLTLPVIVPVVFVLWTVVRLDGGPGFFLHQRIGLKGRPFQCLKIRSMNPGAAEQLGAILSNDPALQSQWRTKRKLENDPRITRIGRFLRQTSLDELPQLWNVVRGEMSLVGPRPVPLDELANYASSRQIYEAMRPGITGLWQISGRNSVSYQERIQLDARYLEIRSLKVDVMILWRTLRLVVQPNGI
ncbi:MAG: sugar transferase [Pseudomonadota bacterium]|nr:sugar transferase [Pseudomonadota bacterium]